MSEAPGNALNLLYLQIGQRHEWALSPALSTVKCLLNKRLLRPLKSSSRPHYHSSGVGCWHLAGRSTRSWARGPSRKIANKGPFPHSLSLSAVPSSSLTLTPITHTHHKRMRPWRLAGLSGVSAGEAERVKGTAGDCMWGVQVTAHLLSDTILINQLVLCHCTRQTGHTHPHATSLTHKCFHFHKNAAGKKTAKNQTLKMQNYFKLKWITLLQRPIKLVTAAQQKPKCKTVDLRWLVKPSWLYLKV